MSVQSASGAACGAQTSSGVVSGRVLVLVISAYIMTGCDRNRTADDTTVRLQTAEATILELESSSHSGAEQQVEGSVDEGTPIAARAGSGGPLDSTIDPVWRSASASSEWWHYNRWGGKVTYPAFFADPRRDDKVWASVVGDAEGAWLEVPFDGPVTLSRVGVFALAQKHYESEDNQAERTGRIKSGRFVVADGLEFPVYLELRDGWQYFDIERTTTDRVRLFVDEVYEGPGYNNVAVSGVQFFGRPAR